MFAFVAAARCYAGISNVVANITSTAHIVANLALTTSMYRMRFLAEVTL
jgi:hypothetical protein